MIIPMLFIAVENKFYTFTACKVDTFTVCIVIKRPAIIRRKWDMILTVFIVVSHSYNVEAIDGATTAGMAIILSLYLVTIHISSTTTSC